MIANQFYTWALNSIKNYQKLKVDPSLLANASKDLILSGVELGKREDQLATKFLDPTYENIWSDLSSYIWDQISSCDIEGFLFFLCLRLLEGNVEKEKFVESLAALHERFLPYLKDYPPHTRAILMNCSQVAHDQEDGFVQTLDCQSIATLANDFISEQVKFM